MSGSEKKQTTSDASGLKSKLLLLIGSPVIVIFICSIVICVSAKRLENEPTGEPSTAEQNVLSNPSDNASASVLKSASGKNSLHASSMPVSRRRSKSN